MLRVIGLVCVLAWSGPPARPAAEPTGVLLLAHGGNASWDANVRAIAASVDRVFPADVAFGMASRPAIQAAVDRLTARGVARIVAVPLFVSSHSSVMEATAYLLGRRSGAPPELTAFARMAHGGHGGPGGHGTHAPDEADRDATRPVRLTVPLVMTPALDAHPVVAEIAASRARSVSVDPAREAVVLVAHGPETDDVNARWMANLTVVAAAVQRGAGFASADALTLRDDAPAPIREAATAELRALVARRIAEGRSILVVPILLSYGGIEAGIRERLAGLAYVMPAQGLAPDPRLADWVLDRVRSAGAAVDR